MVRAFLKKYHLLTGLTKVRKAMNGRCRGPEAGTCLVSLGTRERPVGLERRSGPEVTGTDVWAV